MLAVASGHLTEIVLQGHSVRPHEHWHTAVGCTRAVLNRVWYCVMPDAAQRCQHTQPRVFVRTEPQLKRIRGRWEHTTPEGEELPRKMATHDPKGGELRNTHILPKTIVLVRPHSAYSFALWAIHDLQMGSTPAPGAPWAH